MTDTYLGGWGEAEGKFFEGEGGDLEKKMCGKEKHIFWGVLRSKRENS